MSLSIGHSLQEYSSSFLALEYLAVQGVQLIGTKTAVEGLQAFWMVKRTPLLTKIATVAAIVFVSLSSLALTPVALFSYFLGKTIQRFSSSPFSSGINLKEAVDLAGNIKERGWQEKTAKLVHRSRKDSQSIEDEIARLRGTGIFNLETEIKLTAAILLTLMFSKESHAIASDSSRLLEAKALFGQGLEIKRIYGKTHHVFFHAQQSAWEGIVHLMKEVAKQKDSPERLRHFKFLRQFSSNPKEAQSWYSSVSNFFKNPLGRRGIEEFSRAWSVADNQPSVREKLISVDGYHFNWWPYESSLFFLLQNTNIFSANDGARNLFSEVITRSFPNLTEDKVESCVSKFMGIMNSLAAAGESHCGNLFVICVPKEDTAKIQYRAHPFGEACNCHPGEDSQAILERLQSGNLDSSTACDLRARRIPVPQYRLYAPEVNPGHTRIFALPSSGLDAERRRHRKRVKQGIQALAQELAASQPVNQSNFRSACSIQ